MSVCTFYLKACENPPNLEEIKGHISSGSVEEKISAVKDLIKCMINDETYPSIIMHIITNIIPAQHKNNELRKIMLLYW
jgi:vesicle coat complex subunit